MELSSKERKDLLARSHALKPVATLAGEELSEGMVAHVRQAFQSHDLIKVRLGIEDRDACDKLADDLAARVPCALVKRVGRVLVLHKVVE